MEDKETRMTKMNIDDGVKFWKELKKTRARLTRLLKPRAYYTKDYDIFSLNWGRKKCKQTIELNLLGSGNLRFDLNEKDEIVGIEIDNLKDVLTKFNCDIRETKRRRTKDER